MFESLGEKIDMRCAEMDAALEKRLGEAEKRVEQIAKAAGLQNHVSAGDDEQDRKRLKVRKEEKRVLLIEESGECLTKPVLACFISHGSRVSIGCSFDQHAPPLLASQERLKEALELSKANERRPEAEAESWMEWLFGICPPNGRLGKAGSR